MNRKKQPPTNRQLRRLAAFDAAWKDGKRLKGLPRRMRRATAKRIAEALLRQFPPPQAPATEAAE